MDVGAWLRGLGLGQYEPAFRDNDVDAEILPELAEADLERLGVASLGHRKRLLKAIAALRPGPHPGGATFGAADPDPGVPSVARSGGAERRQLTVMFVDLVGSTALSSRLDPEEMREILRVYQNAVTGEIARLEGHVAKLMGDGVLAYFGWPRAHEDDAERAARAGLASAAAVGRLPAPTGEPLAARVGIATGLVVVGDLIGEGAAQEEAVVGETPNLAARLQEAAPPGGVVIADGTRRLLGELFELQPLGPIRLKGFVDPVGGFRVLGERPAGSRFEARRPGRLSPMIGRDQELALVLERWRQAGAGEGQAVLLVGEAGIGKSRLARAVLDAVAEAEYVALRYQCSPHHTGTALWPIARQLAHAAEFEPGDNDVAKLDKLEVLLRQGAADTGEAAPLMAALLGIDPGDRYPALDLSPQQQRQRTLAVLVDQLLGLARRRPVLMVLEDVHWGDPTTLELLGRALDRISGARALMLLTSRSDNQPSLGGHPHVTRLTLNRLGRGPTEAIVAGLASGRALPPGLLAEITARTDGVPLFVEELTKAVLEAGATGAAVPASLHASLMARLDRVPGVKEVAQVAACIGREFGYPLLAAVSPVPEPELRAALDRLAAAELVFARGEPPEAGYTFKHALVRDAAHESLLKVRRQELHARIARVLEERFPETAATHPEVLAHHFGEAGLAEQAIAYWLRAGQGAARRSANAEAAANLTRGLELLALMPASRRRDEAELALQSALGMALIATKGYAERETGAAYARAQELCEALDTDQLLPILYGRWVYHCAGGDQPEGRRLAEEFLSLPAVRADPAMELVGNRMLGISLLHLGELAEARVRIERALALYDPERDASLAFRFGQDQRAAGLAFLAVIHWLTGFADRADATIGRALAALDRPHANSRGYLLWVAATLAQLRRDVATARRLAGEAIAFSEEHGLSLWLAYAKMVHGWAVAADRPQAEEPSEFARAMAETQATRSRVLHWPHHLGLLAEALGRSGKGEEGLRLVGKALVLTERYGERWCEAELRRLEGGLLLSRSRGDAAGAEAAYEAGLALARRQGAKSFELRAATALARLWRDRGRQAEARDLLAPVYGWFTEGFDTPDVRDARALLDELR